jgi:uncharacterized protein YoxC
MMKAILCVGLLAFTNADANGVNPIRKIVTLLQDMQSEVEAEGAKEKELYDKFMCFCNGGAEDLAKTAADSKSAVETLTAKYNAGTSEKASLSQDIKTHVADKAAAEKDLSEATSIRDNEKAAYDAEFASKSGTEAALSKAIPAIEQGLSGAALVQAPGLNLVALRKAVSTANQVLTSGNKRTILGFLEGRTPGSSEILGMLKSMKDEMSRTLAEMEKSEASSVKGFDDMKTTKLKEIEFARASTETKKERSGALAVEIIQTKGEIDDAAKEQADAEKFLATLDKQCADKKKEWAERTKTRAEEISAIGQAIAILNDDDALDVFKKAAASSLIEIKPKSFLQFKGHEQQGLKLLKKAEAIISKSAKQNKDHAVQMLLLAMRSKLRTKSAGAVDFGEVVKMVDDMVSVLVTQQKDDLKQKDFCIAEITKSEREMADTQDKISSLGSTIEEMTDAIADATQSIADLTASVAALDKDLAEATANRKEEHAEYLETLKLTETAVELLGKAKNRLNKFYNPSVYKAPPKTEMSMEDKIVAAGTSALAQSETTFDTDDTSFVQIKSHVAPPEAPEAKFGGPSKKSGGVIGLMDMMIGDLKMSLGEIKFGEKTAQTDYVDLMAASQDKRMQDGKSLTDQEAGKADLTEKLTQAKETQHLTLKELENIHSTISGLHGACDFIIKNFEYREKARTSEIEGLKNAKAVLAGASFS